MHFVDRKAAQGDAQEGVDAPEVGKRGREGVLAVDLYVTVGADHE
jgi:hypothetical protein